MVPSVTAGYQQLKDWARYSRPSMWLARNGHNAKERFLEEIEEVGDSFAYDLPNDAKQALLHPIKNFKEVTDEIENRLHPHERYYNWRRRRRLMKHARDRVRLPLRERLADRLRGFYPRENYNPDAEAIETPLPTPAAVAIRMPTPTPVPVLTPALVAEAATPFLTPAAQPAAVAAAANANAAAQPIARAAGLELPAKFKPAKTLDDIIAVPFFDLERPEQPAGTYGLGIWKWGNTYQITTSVVPSQRERTHDYTKLKNPKSARKLADSLCSKFLKTSLIGIVGKWMGCYEVQEDKDKVIAIYNLGRNSILDRYDRIIAYEANKRTGDVKVTYKCNEAVPEKVIANDLYKLRRSLRIRPKYFVKNLGADGAQTPAATNTPAPADAHAPAEEQIAELHFGNDVYRLPQRALGTILQALAPYRTQAQGN